MPLVGLATVAAKELVEEVPKFAITHLVIYAVVNFIPLLFLKDAVVFLNVFINLGYLFTKTSIQALTHPSSYLGLCSFNEMG